MIDKSVFLADGAKIVGDVSIGENSSIWYNAVLRADRTKITIGKSSNIQDLCIIHGPARFPVRIGDFVTVGHGAKIHGAEIGDNTLIGMGAILMNGSRIGSGCVVAASSVITESMVVPDGSLVMGAPAKVIRQLSAQEIEGIKANAIEYIQLAKSPHRL